MFDFQSAVFAVLFALCAWLLRGMYERANTPEAKRARAIEAAAKAVKAVADMKPATPTPADIALQAHEKALLDQIKADAPNLS